MANRDLAAGAALAPAGCGSSSSSKNSTDTADAAPKSMDTKGARVLHYTLDGRDEIPVVPKKRGRLLVVLLHGRGAGPQQFVTRPLFAGLAAPGSPVVVMLNGGDHSYWHDRSSVEPALRVGDRPVEHHRRPLAYEHSCIAPAPGWDSQFSWSDQRSRK